MRGPTRYDVIVKGKNHNEANKKLSDLIDRDIILVEPEIQIDANKFEKLSDFAYRTRETAIVMPLVVGDGWESSTEKIDLEKIRLYEHLWMDCCKSSCIYLKKDVVMALGDFYIQDFCTDEGLERLGELIKQLGYRMELCDTVIMHHTEMSRSWESDYGYPEIFDNIRLQNRLSSDKKNLLYVVQADFSGDASNNIGGTQLHVKDLVYGMSEQYQVFVAARDGVNLRVTAYTDTETFVFKFYMGMSEKNPVFNDEKQRRLFHMILNAFSIDLVHVHHTYSFSTEVYEEAAERHIPIVATLHDFYFLCPTLKMFDYNQSCCIGRDCPTICKKCLYELMGISESLDYINYWREHTKHILELCDKIIVPSENAKQIFSEYFPEIGGRIQVIEHGYDTNSQKISELIMTDAVRENIEVVDQCGQCTEIRGWAYYSGANNNSGKIYVEVTDHTGKSVRIPTYKIERWDVAQGNSANLRSGFQAFVPNGCLEKQNLSIKIIVSLDGQDYSSGKQYPLPEIVIRDTQNLRVAFIGGLSAAKGSRQIYEIMQKDIPGIDWYIFGGIDDERLQNLKRDNLTWTNFYQRDDLWAYLNLHKIDIIVILSLWPETFCYTLSEAVTYRRPVIVTDVGALGDRTKQMKCGWTVALDQVVSGVADILERIKTRTEEFQLVCHEVNQVRLRSLNEMNAEYLKLYGALDAERSVSETCYADEVYAAWQGKMVPVEGEKRNISEDEYQSYIIKLEQEIQELYQSRSYRLAKKLSVIWSRLKR